MKKYILFLLTCSCAQVGHNSYGFWFDPAVEEYRLRTQESNLEQLKSCLNYKDRNLDEIVSSDECEKQAIENNLDLSLIQNAIKQHNDKVNKQRLQYAEEVAKIKQANQQAEQKAEQHRVHVYKECFVLTLNRFVDYKQTHQHAKMCFEFVQTKCSLNLKQSCSLIDNCIKVGNKTICEKKQNCETIHPSVAASANSIKLTCNEDPPIDCALNNVNNYYRCSRHRCELLLSNLEPQINIVALRRSCEDKWNGAKDPKDGEEIPITENNSRRLGWSCAIRKDAWRDGNLLHCKYRKDMFGRE